MAIKKKHTKSKAKESNNLSKRRRPNLDISTWRSQIEKAIAEGHSPGDCVWGKTSTTTFDENEWIWN